jgi:superfamily II DNA or RNA helicase
MIPIEIKHCVCIRKKELTQAVADRIYNDLTVFYQPDRNIEAVDMACWNETDTHLLLPRGYLSRLDNRRFVRHDSTSPGKSMHKSVKFVGQYKVYPHFEQKQVVQTACRRLREHLGGIMAVMCGGGKTVMAIAIATHFFCKTAIFVASNDLAEQWAERIQQYCPEAKTLLINGKTKLFSDRETETQKSTTTTKKNKKNKKQQEKFSKFDFYICTLQYAFRHLPQLAPKLNKHCGLVIVDEVHHIAARTFATVLSNLSARYRLGLSATPDRSDGLTPVLQLLFGPMICNIGRPKGEKMHVKLITYTPTAFLAKSKRLSGSRAGDRFALINTITMLVRNEERNQYLLQWIKHLYTHRQQSVIFSSRVEHLQHLFKLTQRHLAVPEDSMRLFTGKTSRTARRQVFQPHVRLIFATYQLAAEGLDVETLDGCLRCIPHGKVEQCAGRFTRGQDKSLQQEIMFRTVLSRFLQQKHHISSTCSYLQRCVPLLIEVVDDLQTVSFMSYAHTKVYTRLGYHIQYLRV